MTSSVFEAIYEQSKNGADREIAQSIGMHPTTTYNVISAVSKVGYDTAKQILVDRRFKTHTYSAENIAEIIEQMVSKGMTLWDGVFTFMVQLERLRQLVNLRNKQGCRLTGALILSKFKWVGKLGSINERNAQDETDQNLPSNVVKTNHCQTYVPRNVTKAEIEALEDNPRRIGKANVAPRAYSGRKIMRNKSTLAGIKQQKRIKQRIEEAKQNLETLELSAANVEISQ